MMDGSTQERHLMAVLRDHGFTTIRAPGSGTGDYDLPDVLAAKDGIIFVGEVKSGSRPSNLKSEEVEGLTTVADDFLGAALAAIRYKGDRTFYLADVEALSMTDGGNYSIPVEDNLPWIAALPYSVGDDGVEAREDVGDQGVVYASDDPPPTLTDLLDAIVASQQGYQVRNGVIDLGDQGGESDE